MSRRKLTQKRFRRQRVKIARAKRSTKTEFSAQDLQIERDIQAIFDPKTPAWQRKLLQRGKWRRMA